MQAGDLGFVAGSGCRRVGSGPSIVLVHANGGDGRDFAPVVPALVAAGWTVTTCDLPGHGASPRRSPEGAVAFGEHLAHVVAALPDKPHVLLGNSVGGFAALHVAARHPELVRGLVLVAPGGFTPRWPVASLACRVMGTQPVARRAMRVLPRMYLRERNGDVADAIRRADEAASQPERVATYAALWRSFTDPAHDGARFARSVTCPTLLVWGRRDPILPSALDGRRARRALPHASVTTIDSGHQPFLERPGAFVEAVVPFLRSIEKERP